MAEFFKIDQQHKKKIVKRNLREWSVKYMDDQAQDEGFDDLMDIRIPDDDSPEEEALKQAGNAFRKAVRSVIKQIRKDVEDDIRPMPTKAELISELPELTLP
jgi:hypothetical protein